MHDLREWARDHKLIIAAACIAVAIFIFMLPRGGAKTPDTHASAASTSSSPAPAPTSSASATPTVEAIPDEVKMHDELLQFVSVFYHVTPTDTTDTHKAAVRKLDFPIADDVLGHPALTVFTSSLADKARIDSGLVQASTASAKDISVAQVLLGGRLLYVTMPAQVTLTGPDGKAASSRMVVTGSVWSYQPSGQWKLMAFDERTAGG